MIRIRFPNGQAIKYNSANGYKILESGAIEIVERVGGVAKYWYAIVPPGATCIIEGADPCRVENPVAGLTLDKALEMVTSHAREADSWRLASLKGVLAKFNAKRRRWK